MRGSSASARDRLVGILHRWVEDPELDVVAVEVVEGRVAFRMRQASRDFTTIWCDPGDRTVGFEAYVLPAPPHPAVAHRLLLRWNSALRDAAFALDGDGAVVMVARLRVDDLDDERLGEVVGELWEGVERAFRTLIRVAFRET